MNWKKLAIHAAVGVVVIFVGCSLFWWNLERMEMAQEYKNRQPIEE